MGKRKNHSMKRKSKKHCASAENDLLQQETEHQGTSRSILISSEPENNTLPQEDETTESCEDTRPSMLNIPFLDDAQEPAIANSISTPPHDEEGEQAPVEQSSIEIIDVDKLPDIPYTPIIGDDVIEIIVSPEKSEPSSSTSTSHVHHRRFVDLTDLDDTSPIIEPDDEETRQKDVHATPLEHRKKDNEKNDSSDISDVEDSISDDEDMPSVFLKKKKEKPKQMKDSMLIVCPICQDDAKQIKSDSRQLASTVCGHIFCDVCVKEAIKTQQKCPTCRRRLTKKQVHPIFI